MKQLELKHLAPYLPYGLRLWHIDWECQIEMNATGSGSDCLSIEDIEMYAKPILRPLSDLTKEIEVNGEIFVPFHKLRNEWDTISINNNVNIELYVDDRFESDLMFFPYDIIQKLLKWHFDVFGLIEIGLAIDINSLK